MKKRSVFLVLLSLFILASCVTVSPGEGTETDDRGKNAVLTLVEDTLSSVGEECVSAEDFGPALPLSYTVYSAYIPSYDEIVEKYLSSVASLVNEGVSGLFLPAVLSAAEQIADNPSSYLSGASVTESLRSATEEILTESLTSFLEEREGELDSFFTESREAFGRVKKAYSALSAVSKGVYLPSSRALDIKDIVSVSVDKYFSLLERGETSLRTNPLYGERSLYLGEEEI